MLFTHSLHPIGVNLCDPRRVLGRLGHLAKDLPSLLLDERELLLNQVQASVGVAVDRLEREPVLDRLQLLEERVGERLGAVVGRAGVGVGVREGVGLVQRVLDDGVALDLGRRK